jgi:hypothetical protein
MPGNFEAEANWSHVGWAWHWLLPLSLLAFGFWLVPLTQTCRLDCVPGDLGDARFNGVILEHFYLWLTGRDVSLLSPPFFYPMPGALTFSDNHWGTAWLYSVFRILGWDRYQSYDLWYLTGYVINFVVCHCVFRKLRFSPLASAIAAFAFAFPMPAIVQYGHAQLTYRFLMPVGLLLWQRFRQSGQWNWIGWLSLAVVAQFYISIYLGYFLSLFIAAWAVSQWCIEGWGPRQWFQQWRLWRQGPARSELIVALLMVFVAIAALAALMQPYMHYSKVYGFQRSAEEVASMLPRLQSYLVADESGIWGGLSKRLFPSIPMRQEHQMFFGLGILGLAFLGFVRSPIRLRWVALVSVLILVLLTLNVGGHSLYSLLQRLPGLGAIRAVARIGLVMALPIALLAAIAVDAHGQAAKPWRVLLALLVTLMVCESATMRTATFSLADARTRILRLTDRLPASIPADAILFNPIRPGEEFFLTELDGLVLAQGIGRPTLNGYSGNIPPGYVPQTDASACMQALLRLKEAATFFAGRLNRPVPAGVSGPVVIVGESRCGAGESSEMPLNQADKVSLQIESLEQHDGRYAVRVAIVNGSDYAINLSSGRPWPLHLSWQKVLDRQVIDPLAWRSRVEVSGGQTILSMQRREVLFTVPAIAGEKGFLAVSAVLEGRAWLNDHGLRPAFHDIPVVDSGDVVNNAEKR